MRTRPAHQTVVSGRAGTAWKGITEKQRQNWKKVSIEVKELHKLLYPDWWKPENQAQRKAARKEKAAHRSRRLLQTTPRSRCPRTGPLDLPGQISPDQLPCPSTHRRSEEVARFIHVLPKGVSSSPCPQRGHDQSGASVLEPCSCCL